MNRASPRKNAPVLVWEHLLSRPRKSRGNLSTQLVTSFIDAIDGNMIPEGVRLPSSRSLADNLRLGRNTVIAATSSLVEQGYLISKDRSGLFVAPRRAASTPARKPDRPADKVDWRARLSLSSDEGEREPIEALPPVTHNFKYGQFDLSTFPVSHWRMCERSASAITEMAEWGRDMFDRDDVSLIESLRRHVLPSHGIWAEPDEILVTLGGQEGRFLVASLLCRPGTTTGIENPGMPDINDIVSTTPTRRVYLPIDDEGVSLSAALRQCDVAFVTLGHQCPTTAVMSLERRLALLDVAARREMIVVEDTYETETVAQSNVVPALKSLDREERVIHIGSLSKSIAPGLRIGFVVASPIVIGELREIRRRIHRHPPGNVQRALAMFIDRGYYHSFLRRVSGELNQRTQAFKKALARWLPDATYVHHEGSSTFWVRLPDRENASRLCKELRQRGLVMEAGDRFFFDEPRTNFMRMSVSQVSATAIDGGFKIIASVRKRRGRVGAP